jgi:hypothetical protein
MAHAQLPIAPRRFGETMRKDWWWLQPAIVLVLLSAFIGYATWAAFQGQHYAFGPYLSPFYSPELFGSSPHAWFGPKPGWWPAWLVFSPALLILPFPGLFRLTCYYYRGAYYKAFWADPPACAVGEPRKEYCGEAAFPLIVQNIHRYFLYIALFFLVVLARDVYEALWFTDPSTGQTSFGIGVGTLVLTANVIGGYIDQLSRTPVRRRLYDCSSCFNRAHMRWAWTSLFSVAFADLYVRLCSMGIWTDWRIL